jgi:hypothetical protein
MNKLLLAALVAVLSALFPSSASGYPETVDRTIYVIFVQSPSHPLSADEMAASLSSIRNGAQFWNELSPISTTLALAEPQVITVDGDLSASFWSWSKPYWRPVNDITFFVLDAQPRPGVTDNLAQTWAGDEATLVWGFYGSGDWFSATSAHELGHAAFLLPHALGAGDGNDIMSLAPMWAYQSRSVGCTSRERLGHPCHKVFLPLVSN